MMIAIDGPAGAGKSTIARALAKRLKAIYVDTGAMYRAITLKALRQGISDDDEERLAEMAERTEIHLTPIEDGEQRVYLDGEDVTEVIRRKEINRHVSQVAAHPKVRAIMRDRQRKLAEKGDIVMDGRDIGTVVLPDADVKIFLTASVQERAKRRYKEYLDRGEAADVARIEEEIRRRDRMDQERQDSPLTKAEDAIEVDTTHLSIDQVIDRLYSICISHT